MAKKQKSFADKASAKGSKDVSYIKYVKSVESGKQGFWRFNEQMIAVDKGETLDGALKRIQDEKTMAGIEIPSMDEPGVVEASVQDEVSVEAEEDDNSESSDIKPEESSDNSEKVKNANKEDSLEPETEENPSEVK